MGLQLAVNYYLANELMADGFGVYSVVVSTSLIGATIALFGLDMLSLRSLSVLSGAQDHVESERFVVGAARSVLSAGIVGSAALAVAFVGLRFLAGSSSIGSTMIVGAPLIAMTALHQLMISISRARGRVVRSLVPFSVLRFAGLFAAILVFHRVLDFELTPIAAMSMLLLASAVSLGVAIAWASVSSSLFLSRVSGSGRGLRRQSRAMAISSIATLLIAHSDLLVAGAMRTEAEAGAYAAAVRVVLLVPFGLQSVNLVTAPLIARAHANSCPEKVRVLVHHSTRLASMASIGALGVCIFLGRWILNRLGPDFAQAFGPLTILAVAHLVNGLTGPAANLLNMVGDEQRVARVLVGAAGINVVVSATLARPFGLNGIAVGTATSLIFWNVVLARRSKSILGFSPAIVSALKRPTRS